MSGIITGAKSIGMSSGAPPPPALPDYSGDVQETIQYLLDKVRQMDTIIEGKADSNRLKTLIQYSDEAIRIQAEDIILVGDVTIAKIIKNQNGTAPGTLPYEITRIIGDVVQTGTIRSNNYSATAGTAINLDAGTIIIGGSSNPKLLFDEEGDLTVSGTITADSFIATRQVTDVLDDLDAKLDPDALQTILSEGVGNIFAGIGQDYVLDVGNSYVAARHKDANINGLGSGYSGTLRTGLLVSANGLGMGFNDKTTGAWTNSIVLDGTTGNVSILGTLTAGSVITNTVTVDGTPLSTIVANAAAGKALKDALEVSGTTVLKGVLVPTDAGALRIGSITWDTTTGALTGGTGAAITEWGIIGASSGTATFTLNASTGAATFAGALSAATGTFAGSLSAATGTFAGNLSAAGGTFAGALAAATGSFSGNVTSTGYIYATGGTNAFAGDANAAVNGVPSDSGAIGVYGFSTSKVGVRGGSTFGIGVDGVASGFPGVAVTARASGGAAAINASGGNVNLNTCLIIKVRTAGHVLKVWDSSTGTLVGTYEYQFE